jgi:predicted metal-dependent HD superfamily phosphohydrolase
MDNRKLFDTWVWLLNASGASCNPKSTWRGIREHYTEPHRHYHTLAHIGHCLDEFEYIRAFVQNPIAIMYAIIYHDYIYYIRRKSILSNEELSAIIAKNFLYYNKLYSLGDSVFDLVVATDHLKDREGQSEDQMLLVDIDLSGLGQAPETFAAHNELIRREYAHVPDEEFRQESTKLLTKFFNYSPLYRTEYFFNKYERQAKINLRGSLEELQAA